MIIIWYYFHFRSLGAEILYNLATGSKNITESLTRFGLGDADRDLLAVIVTKEGPNCACAAELRLKDNIEGRLAGLNELDSVERDLAAVRKAHKLKEAECAHGNDFLKSLLISKTASKDIVT